MSYQLSPSVALPAECVIKHCESVVNPMKFIIDLDMENVQCAAWLNQRKSRDVEMNLLLNARFFLTQVKFVYSSLNIFKNHKTRHKSQKLDRTL